MCTTFETTGKSWDCLQEKEAHETWFSEMASPSRIGIESSSVECETMKGNQKCLLYRYINHRIIEGMLVWVILLVALGGTEASPTRQPGRRARKPPVNAPPAPPPPSGESECGGQECGKYDLHRNKEGTSKEEV
jgi:hypothetical protein